MTDVEALVAFIRARLAERERLAKDAGIAACGNEWGASDSGIYPADNPAQHPGPFLAGAHGHTDLGYGEHIAANDPRYVRDDIASKREILAVVVHHLADDDTDETAWHFGHQLALPFASHPGYRQEWRAQ